MTSAETVSARRTAACLAVRAAATVSNTFAERTTSEGTDSVCLPSRGHACLLSSVMKTNVSLWDNSWAGLLAARCKRCRFPKFGLPCLPHNPLPVQTLLGCAVSPRGNQGVPENGDFLAIAIAISSTAALCLWSRSPVSPGSTQDTVTGLLLDVHVVKIPDSSQPLTEG